MINGEIKSPFQFQCDVLELGLELLVAVGRGKYVSISLCSCVYCHFLPCRRMHLKKWYAWGGAGIYNGTRMIVTDELNNNIFRCTIINGSNTGDEISILRIKPQPQDLTNQPCEWERLQFPVRLDYAMTIDKNLRETLETVGVWLVNAVFGHGELYVSASITGVYSTVVPPNQGLS